MKAVVAMILEIQGEVLARDESGNTRLLDVGAELYEGETLITGVTGRVVLQLPDQQSVTIAGEQSILLTENILAEKVASVDDNTIQDQSIADVLAVLEAGGDLTEDLEATAAGAGAGGDGGSMSLRLLSIAEQEGAQYQEEGGVPEVARVVETVTPISYQTDPLSTESIQVTTDASVANEVIPSIAIDDVTVIEGNEEQPATAIFTVSLSEAATSTVTVSYTTADGTATAGLDYTAVSGVLTFAPGETVKQIAVPISPDTIYEGNETFDVNLTNPSNATISDAQGLGTIVDNDAEPTITIDDVTVNEDAGTATFTVSLSNPSAFPVSVDYATADGSATAGLDYTAQSGTLNFAAGDTTETITVPISEDLIYEGNETFDVNLTNPSNATISDAQGLGTIVDNDAEPTITIDDVTVNEDAGTATFTVSLSNPSAFPVSVDYATADGSATAGLDYTAQSGTLNFAAGDTTETITVPISEDLIYEGNETFDVNLTNASNATISDPQGLGTIVDNDAEPTITIDDVTVNEDAGTATFTVSLSNPSAFPVSVDYATADGSATAGLDYTAQSGTLNFAAGDTTETITVPISEDLIYEGNETFDVNLTNPSNATISDAQGLGTIVDNDAEPTITIDDVTVNEDAGTATFTVSLSNPSAFPVSVDYATADGSATAGLDYTAQSGTLNFAAGDTTETITVPISEDLIYEGNETFDVNLTNPSNATISDAQGLGTIVDNDAEPTITIDDVTVNEDAGTATFTVSLSNPSAFPVSVDYATADGSATAGLDYTAQSGTLNFAAGDTTETITVPISEDLIYEGNETFDVNLTNPSNATISDAQGLGTIVDNDAEPTITIDDVTVNEDAGTATFTVSLSNPSAFPVSVDYATADGSATAGLDYTAQSGTLNFAAGDTTETITVPISEDLIYEGNETFDVNLTNPSNATISDAQGLGTIVDNDAEPTITIDDVTVNEDAGTATFTVSLSNPSAFPVSVDYATADGSATAGLDYTAQSGTLNFAAGDTTETITVPISEDLIYEGNETFDVNLTNPSNATISDAQGLGTIVDNDAEPTITIDDVTVNEDAGTATFTVSLSNPSAFPVSVDYATADGSATAGLDYTAQSGTLNFAAGDTTETITVPISEDLIYEGNETFDVNLTNPSNATISDAQGLGTIVDNDALTTAVSVDEDDISGASGNAGGTGDITPVTSGTITYDLNGESVDSIVLSTSVGGANGTGLSALDGTSIITVWDAATNTLIGYKSNAPLGSESDADYLVFTVAVSSITDSGASYDATLYQPIKHHELVAADDVEGSLSVVISAVISGDGGLSTSGSFDLTINDDTPVDFTATSTVVAPGETDVGIALNFEAGADSANPNGYVLDFSNYSDGGQVTTSDGQLLFYGSDFEPIMWSQVSPTQVQGTVSGVGAVFTLTVDGNTGSYTFSAVDGTFYVQNDITITPSNTDIQAGNDPVYGIVDLAGTETDIVVTGSAGDVNSNSLVFGTGNVYVNNGQTLTFDFYDDSTLNGGAASYDTSGLTDSEINNFVFNTVSVKSTPTFTVEAFDQNGDPVSVIVYDDNGTQVSTVVGGDTVVTAVEGAFYQVVGTDLYQQVVITGLTGADTGKNFSVKIDGVSNISEHDVVLSVDATAIDQDGDSAAGTITVGIDQDDVAGVTIGGQLIDGFVAGLAYTTSSGLSGFTAENGGFNYHLGDSVSFSIGNVLLGTVDSSRIADVMSDGKLFLQEIADIDLNVMDNQYVENMAVLLQSLDNNADAYDGIHISEAMHELFSDEQFDLANISGEELAGILESNGLTPVSVEDAMAHVEDMLIEHGAIDAAEDSLIDFSDDGLDYEVAAAESESDSGAESADIEPVELAEVVDDAEGEQVLSEGSDVAALDVPETQVPDETMQQIIDDQLNGDSTDT
ncbi:retention module-containing protein [Thiomicrorhabdus sediminis]|nr:retention module-containing protein [Thiomicrorhabdus sediminis]